VRVTIAYPPPAAQRSESSYSRWTSQKPTSGHDIIKLKYTKHEVHTGFLQWGSCRLQRELRLIRSSWVARPRCRLLSAKYWVRLLKEVLGQYPILQYRYRSNPKKIPSTDFLQHAPFPDISITLSLTILRSSLNSITFPGFPGKSSPCYSSTNLNQTHL